MPTLEIDALTAAVALRSLEPAGHDIAVLATSLDEDWRRFAVPQGSGRHLISTIGSRSACPPYGLPYLNTALIRPDPVRAEDRPIGERFMRNPPRMCAEILPTEDGYRLDVAMLRVGNAVVTIDRIRGIAGFNLKDVDLPESTMTAAVGRRIGEVVDLDAGGDLRITGIRRADAKEMIKAFHALAGEGLVVETDLPEWTTVRFDPSSWY